MPQTKLNRVAVRNPATGKILAYYDELDAAGIKQSLTRARAAQPAWAALPLQDRVACIRRMAHWLAAHQERVSAVITDCMGKPRQEALISEVLNTLAAGRWYARQASQLLRARQLARSSLLIFNKRSVVHRLPWGVIGVIAPWNYPLSIPMHEVIPALLAGNVVLFKTAPETLPVGALMTEMLHTSGVPDDVFQHVIADGPLLSECWLGNAENSGVDKLFFTGSTRVGKLLLARAAQSVTPVSVELGGKDAAIVCADADLERAVAGIVWAGLSNAGQSCGGVERVYVDRAVYQPFMQRLTEAVAGLHILPDQPFDTDLGAMCTERQVATVLTQLNEALQAGARVAVRAPLPASVNAQFVPPTVLADVNHDMRIMREETFGPVLCVMPFDTLAQAVQLANDSGYGLTASVWSRNRKQALAIARQLRAGSVMLNEHLVSHGYTETPWGGFKDSGYSRGHGTYIFAAVTAPQVVIEDRFPWLPRNPIWQPYSTASYRRFAHLIDGLYGKGWWRRGRALLRSLPLVGRYFKP